MTTGGGGCLTSYRVMRLAHLGQAVQNTGRTHQIESISTMWERLSSATPRMESAQPSRRGVDGLQGVRQMLHARTPSFNHPGH